MAREGTAETSFLDRRLFSRHRAERRGFSEITKRSFAPIRFCEETRHHIGSLHVSAADTLQADCPVYSTIFHFCPQDAG